MCICIGIGTCGKLKNTSKKAVQWLVFLQFANHFRQSVDLEAEPAEELVGCSRYAALGTLVGTQVAGGQDCGAVLETFHRTEDCQRVGLQSE